ncbi:hypothetical protein PE066_03680 [Ramlibacter tataouinensis]|uniref:hypothetical protein n=1 Tax=Ramlibacter tataouinensis TaxID=94132 RepID=UPI0022F4055D|nr:hypothetical protein [Ramlibacter tataouinensis]WBY02651.1 hypothetical protein PE066_03680 [Ramlibacter tataouinensis]
MQSTAFVASLGLLAALAGSPALAGDRDADRGGPAPQSAGAGTDRTANPGMQAVPHAAGPSERAHGWQYFSDPKAQRAVVISPQGDYYFSRGKGLRWVAAAQSDT